MPHSPHRKDMTGQIFGRLIVTAFCNVDSRRRAIWRCQCECGKECTAATSELTSGHKISCGCALRERLAKGTLRHGKSHTPAWLAWLRMKSRCERPSTQRFKNYGGRGIGYVPRWAEFEAFLMDMGEPPPGFTLERRDVNAGYSPENCEWVPADAQYSNTTRTVRVSFHGIEVPFRDLVKASGMNYDTAYARLKTYGWPAEKVFPNLRPESLSLGSDPDK